MIITISGKPGSGKSTVGKILANEMGYNFYSVGDLRGKMAMDKGMTIDELNELGKTEAWTDREADEYQTKLGKEEDNFVIDSRLGWYFIPHSIKIFIDVKSYAGTERIFKNQRPDEKKQDSVEKLEKMLEERMKSDSARYIKYYGVDYQDKKNYDLIVDSSELKPKQVAKKILDYVKENK